MCWERIGGETRRLSVWMWPCHPVVYFNNFHFIHQLSILTSGPCSCSSFITSVRLQRHTRAHAHTHRNTLEVAACKKEESNVHVRQKTIAQSNIQSGGLVLKMRLWGFLQKCSSYAEGGSLNICVRKYEREGTLGSETPGSWPHHSQSSICSTQI